VTCPQCQGAAPFHDYRRLTPVSLVGEVRLHRAYYRCPRCRIGLVPFDDKAGFTDHRLTPAAERVVSLAGLLGDGFEEAATKALPEMTGLRLSESTVQRTTEDAGNRLGELLDEGATLGKDGRFDWHKDVHGRRCAYVSIDATGVRQQAADGGPAEGRMPYVAMVYNPLPDSDVRQYQAEQLPATPPVAGREQAPPQAKKKRRGKKHTGAGKPKRMQARYLAGLYTLEELGVLLRRQAAQVGMEDAEQWIGLCDGGNGLTNFLQSNFNRPNLVVMLDFYHPTGYLGTLASLWHGAESEEGKKQTEQWCHKLKYEGGEAMFAELKSLKLPARVSNGAAYQEALTYFENHKEKMNYPYYLSQGWQIGSGPVESGCKTVVGQRLKLAGMRWREKGTDGVCHLRALYKSEKDQWEAFWARHVNKGSIFYQQK
jgi:hypothetical protein